MPKTKGYLRPVFQESLEYGRTDYRRMERQAIEKQLDQWEEIARRSLAVWSKFTGRGPHDCFHTQRQFWRSMIKCIRWMRGTIVSRNRKGAARDA